jgi:hypothetical protein
MQDESETATPESERPAGEPVEPPNAVAAAIRDGLAEIAQAVRAAARDVTWQMGRVPVKPKPKKQQPVRRRSGRPLPR